MLFIFSWDNIFEEIDDIFRFLAFGQIIFLDRQNPVMNTPGFCFSDPLWWKVFLHDAKNMASNIIDIPKTDVIINQFSNFNSKLFGVHFDHDPLLT